MSESEYAALVALLDQPLKPKTPGGTASLLDENEPEGAVVLRNAEGVITYIMPRDVYESLKKWKV